MNLHLIITSPLSSPFTKTKTELKCGNDPARVADPHEFDFRRDDEKRSSNNPFNPSNGFDRSAQIRSVSILRVGSSDLLSSPPHTPDDAGGRKTSVPKGGDR
jgi:hypothetical protein